MQRSAPADELRPRPPGGAAAGVSPMTVSLETAFLTYRRTRDPASLAKVYDETAARLLAVAMHLSRSVTAAEDAVQDTFLIALEHPERWDQTRPLLPWLLGILGNRLKQSRHREGRTPDASRLPPNDPQDPVSQLEAGEVLAHIENAITRLAQPYRAVVLLRLRNGLTPADIAIALDRKPSTVRAQLARGVEMLRKLLPVGVTSLLVGATLTGRGLAAVRQVVVGRAEAVRLAARGAGQARWLARVGTIGAGVLTLCLALWFAFDGSRGTPIGPGDPIGDEFVDAAAVEKVVERVELPPLATIAPDERVLVATTGAVVVRVHRAGQPVADAAVTLEPLDDPPLVFRHQVDTGTRSWIVTQAAPPVPEARHRRGATGADGNCRLDGLRAGYWIVRSVGVDEICSVKAGSTVEVMLPSEARLVLGVVVDASGAPIEGAEVWVCRAHIEKFSRGVTHTGRDGRFRAAVAPDAMIGARASGRASVGVSVGGFSAPPVLEVVLTLAEPGSRVAGTVLDERGQPVPGATIQIGHPGDTRVLPGATSPQVVARPVRCVADAGGRFACDGLVPGEVVVMARAPGFGASAQAATLSPASETAVTVQLPRAATITGRVHLADGTPVRGASVSCGAADNLASCATATGADGRFALSGLTPGINLIVVTDHAGGFASRRVVCGAGEQIVWDPEFRADALLLQGRVSGHTGQPFAHGWIAHHTSVAATVHRLDERGRFAIEVHERVAALPSTIEVFDHDPRDRRGEVAGVPLAWASGLVTGTRDNELRIPDPAPRSASLTGRIVGLDGANGDAGAWLGVQLGERWFRQRLDPLEAGGRFHAGPLAAGDYFVTVMKGGTWRFGSFRIAAGEHRDLGDLRVATGADAGAGPQRAVHLACVWPGAPASSEDVLVGFRNDRGALVATKHIASGSDGLTDAYTLLPDGAYRAEATTPSGLSATAVFEVAEGRPRRAVLFALAPR